MGLTQQIMDTLRNPSSRTMSSESFKSACMVPEPSDGLSSLRASVQLPQPWLHHQPPLLFKRLPRGNLLRQKQPPQQQQWVLKILRLGEQLQRRRRQHLPQRLRMLHPIQAPMEIHTFIAGIMTGTPSKASAILCWFIARAFMTRDWTYN